MNKDMRELINKYRGSPAPKTAPANDDEVRELRIAVGNRSKRAELLRKRYYNTHRELLDWCAVHGRQ